MREQLVTIRFDEIGLKGKNRPLFEKRLADNIARALHIDASRVKRERGRIYVYPEREDERLLRRLEQVFGVKTFSPGVRVPVAVEAMEAEAIELARKEVDGGAKTFKVDARRALKSFPLDSMDINAHLGRRVLEAFPELSVDVHQPDFKLQVEVRPSGIFLSTRTYQGPGGVPVGMSGRALLLLSGGIDSPVAGWMLMKRGLAIDAVYFHSPPYTGERAKEKVLELARVLARWKGDQVKVYVPYFTEIQVQTAQHVPSPLWTIIHRRFMHRIAERIAEADGFNALATGESIGQVASQTVQNLQCIDRAVRILVLRPLTGFDKVEIVNLAKRIGTYEISIQPYEDCCTLFAPKNPKTKARLDHVESAESQLPADRLIAEAFERMEVITVNAEDG